MSRAVWGEQERHRGAAGSEGRVCFGTTERERLVHKTRGYRFGFWRGESEHG